MCVSSMYHILKYSDESCSKCFSTMLITYKYDCGWLEFEEGCHRSDEKLQKDTSTSHRVETPLITTVRKSNSSSAVPAVAT